MLAEDDFFAAGLGAVEAGVATAAAADEEVLEGSTEASA